MRLYIFYAVLVLAVLQYSRSAGATEVKFGTICSGNPSNQRRGCDSYGCGAFGASRKGKDGVKRTHAGLDIVCKDGSTIFAPFDVKLSGKAVPYRINNAINDGITLKGEGLCFKLFYVKPDRYSGATLKKGQKIGILLPMQKVYPKITSHVHVQMCDKSDPTKYF
ncbi:leukocyte cell-derived chemotaxin-2 isoform X2 [Misgurnus anguillicaudatus]|uniref:leukocyte cell-derived chemotaxin-2 isoform X2 n=1 Tax=Misgurnus anguillicaudatus TaxID=75329 RepID=UPI00243542EB|nr:leukocyte cell-derived chemotaxin-2-like [Misgurnus anguillicaudatus]